MRGKLISIEGIDACGKSTHAKLLAQWLRKRRYKVQVTDEPTDGSIGRFIKMALRGGVKLPVIAEALLFAADRMQHVEEVIRPALKPGKIVITERYVSSSLAYQSARGLPVGWIEAINGQAIRPDLTILIDLPARTAIERIKGSKELDLFERDLRLQQRVRKNFLRIAKRKDLKIVNGSRPINEVQADIRKIAKSVL